MPMRRTFEVIVDVTESLFQTTNPRFLLKGMDVIRLPRGSHVYNLNLPIRHGKQRSQKQLP